MIMFTMLLKICVIQFLCFFFLGEPHSAANATTDPFKTLFVARIVSNFW